LDNNETGPTGAWGSRPVHAAMSIGVVTFFASVDHLGSIQRITGEGMTLLGCQVLSRATIEAAARSWWLSDPELSVRDRVERGMCERLRAIRDLIRTLEELGADDELLRERRASCDRVLNQAVDLGLPVQFEDGQPTGIRVARPSSTALVGDFLTESHF